MYVLVRCSGAKVQPGVEAKVRQQFQCFAVSLGGKVQAELGNYHVENAASVISALQNGFLLVLVFLAVVPVVPVLLGISLDVVQVDDGNGPGLGL